MEYVLTVAIPFCALLVHCAPAHDVAPLRQPSLHFGDCLDLQHLPIAGNLEDRRSRLRTNERVVWPCGGAAR